MRIRAFVRVLKFLLKFNKVDFLNPIFVSLLLNRSMR